MKICYISNLFHPYEIGGAEFYLNETIKNIKDKENVFVITTSPFHWKKILRPTIEYYLGVKVYRFYPLNISSPYHLRKLPTPFKPLWHAIDLWNFHVYVIIKKILKDERPDVIHTNNVGGFSTSLFTVAKKLSLPTVHTLHDYQLISPWSILFRNHKIIKRFSLLEKIFFLIKRSATKNIDVVLSPSQFVLDYHKKKGFFSKSRLQKIPLGADQNPASIKRTVLKRTFTLLYIGQIAEHKGVHVLIEGFKKINEPLMRLNIAGQGDYMKACKEIAQGDKRITFFGFVKGEEKQKLFLEASVSLIGSVWYDNSPLAIYESFKYAVPVIGSRIGGIPELIIDGYNGLLFSPGDAVDLREKILYIYNRPEMLQTMEENCVKTLKNFSLQKHIESLTHTYATLCKRDIHL